MFIFAYLVAFDNPECPGLSLSENVGSMPNHDITTHIFIILYFTIHSTKILGAPAERIKSWCLIETPIYLSYKYLACP
jgi:hypothetical protein